MCDQHLFPEALAVAFGDDFSRDAREVGVVTTVSLVERERDQSGPRLANRQSKLSCQPVSEIRRSDFRNRKPAGSDDQGWRAKLFLTSPHCEFIAALDFSDSALHDQ